MPFSNYRDSFSPETLAVLEAAFNAAWDAVVTSGVDCDQQATRTALADAIVYFANGPRRPPKVGTSQCSRLLWRQPTWRQQCET